MTASRNVLSQVFAELPEANCLLFIRSEFGKVLGFYFGQSESYEQAMPAFRAIQERCVRAGFTYMVEFDGAVGSY